MPEFGSSGTAPTKAGDPAPPVVAPTRTQQTTRRCRRGGASDARPVSGRGGPRLLPGPESGPGHGNLGADDGRSDHVTASFQRLGQQRPEHYSAVASGSQGRPAGIIWSFAGRRVSGAG
jgi:hypothetical protein